MSAPVRVAGPTPAAVGEGAPRPAAYLHSVSAQALARVIYVGSGAIVFIMLARRFGPAELGLYALVLSLQNIAITAGDLGTTSLLSRDLVASGAGWRRYLGAFIMFRLLLGFLVGGTAALLVGLWSPDELLGALLVCALLLPLNAARFFDPIFQFAGRPYWSTWLALGYAALLPAATWLALADRSTVAAAAGSAFALTGAAYGAAGLVLIVLAGRPLFDHAAIQRIPLIASGASALGAVSLLSMLTLRLDVPLIEWLGGSAAVGLYNAAFRFFDLGVAVVVTLQTPLVPLLARLAAVDRVRLALVCRSLMGWTAALGVAGTLLTACLGPTVLELLFGLPYRSAGAVLALLAAKLTLATLNLLLVLCLMVVAPIGRLWISSAAALATNLALNLLLIPMLGATGAGLAALACELPQLAITALFVRSAHFGIFDCVPWPRVGSAVLAGTVAAALPGSPLLRALLAVGVFAGALRVLRIWPANPLPRMRIN